MSTARFSLIYVPPHGGDVVSIVCEKPKKFDFFFFVHVELFVGIEQDLFGRWDRKTVTKRFFFV